jgi:hypothetical protein
MPLAPSAPYDSLAIVTQMVRTFLGDFIQNIQPNNVGMVNVNAGGLSITWQSGNMFTALMNGVAITINGLPNQIAMVTGPTTATLVKQAAVANGVPYSLVIPTGDIFADSQAYVLPTVNLGWRMVQKKLAEKGHPRLENTALITGIPITTNLDPASEQYMNWQGFFDGSAFQTPATLQGCPTLPADFISPIYIEERQSVAGASPANPNLNILRKMHPASDGLRSRVKTGWNRQFDWREDGVYVRGSLQLSDWKVRYAAFLADIAVAGGGFSVTPVPIMRCAEALANYTAGIFVTPRGSLLGPNFMSAGDAALAQITNSQAKLGQRASYSRRAWGHRGRGRFNRSMCN